MQFDVLTLFPEMFSSLNESIIGRAKTNKQININLDNDQTKNFEFVEAQEGELINLNSLQAKSVEIEDNKLNVVSTNGKTYEFTVYENNGGLYSIVDSQGNLIGTFNKNTGEMNFAQASGPKIDFAETNEGEFVNVDLLDIKSGSYNVEKNTITLKDNDGNDYNFKIVENSNGSFSIRDADNNVIGGFNPATGELTLGNNNEYNFLFSDKNEFIKPEDLSKISSAQYKLSTDGQSGTITIFDGDAQYNLDLQLDKNGKFLINNGDATIGTFDPKTNSITINNETGNDKTFAFTEAKDNKLVNLGDFEVSSAHINVNNGSNLITLVGKDGKEYSFDLTNPNEEGICEIKDVDGNKIGLIKSKDELYETFCDIKKVKVDILTLGQYISPSKKHLPVVKYYKPEEFSELEKLANKAGIKYTIFAPLARSSYKASQTYFNIVSKK